jgi:MOSC domain-containing protein YiiM
MAKVIAVNISEKKGTVKHPIEEGNFIEDFGLEGDAHAGKGIRQVSLLGRESYLKYKDRDVKGLCDGKFAENLTTEGIILYELPIGTVLKIGETVQEVTKIGKECHNGCEIQKLVGSCIMPKEGIFTRVLKGGIVRAGDEITIL